MKKRREKDYTRVYMFNLFRTKNISSLLSTFDDVTEFNCIMNESDKMGKKRHGVVIFRFQSTGNWQFTDSRRLLQPKYCTGILYTQFNV
jgi:hypothetical protein